MAVVMTIYPNCGCVKLYQTDAVEYDGAIITETSAESPINPQYQPIITEDEQYYIVPEDFNPMSIPIKVSELDAADVATIIANAADVDMLLSYDGQSYKFAFTDLITFVKAINENLIFNVTIGADGNTFTSADIDNREVAFILDGTQAYNKQPLNFTQSGNDIAADSFSFYAGQIITVVIKH